MSSQARVEPGTYVANRRLNGEESVYPAADRDPQRHATGLSEDVFAFYFFDVEEDGILLDELDGDRANCSKQYFVDAELFDYEVAKELPDITQSTLERMRTLNVPAMRYAAGRRIRFYNQAWQAIVSRA